MAFQCISIEFAQLLDGTKRVSSDQFHCCEWQWCGWLTHCGLVITNGIKNLININRGQHWFRKWLGAIRHQGITWITVDFSSRSCIIHLKAISPGSWSKSRKCVLNYTLKIIATYVRDQWVNFLKLQWNAHFCKKMFSVLLFIYIYSFTYQLEFGLVVFLMAALTTSSHWLR